MAERHPDARLASEGPPTLSGTMVVGGRSRHYRLVWPPDFPLRPPSVWETAGLDGFPIDHSSTGHVFQDKSLCLFAHRAQHGWLPERSAADALDQFLTFCGDGDAGLFLNALRRPVEWDLLRVSLPPPIAEALRRGGGWGIAKGLMRTDYRMFWITHADGTHAGRISAGTIDIVPPESWRIAGGFQAPDLIEVPGVWCRIRWGGPATPDAPRDRARLLSCIHSQLGRGAEFVVGARMVLVVDDETGELSFVFLNPDPATAAALKDRGDPLIVMPTVVEDLRERLFLRVDGRLSGRAMLERARVAIVGCGSVGGHVAVSLARAGVGRFVLFDPEVLEPENVLRHVGGLAQIGVKKVEVVASAIRGANPDADVVTKPFAVSADPTVWSQDSAAALNEVLDDPNGVVICTAAADEVDRLVNAACIAKRCPAVYAWLMGRAEHGRVFRVFPHETPCYVCIVRGQAAEPGRFVRFDAPETVVERPAYGQPGIPGLSMDIEQVALLAARLALQTIARRMKAPLGYPDSHGDHLLWSNHEGWALDGPLQARVERIPRDPSCPACGAVSTALLDVVEQQALGELRAALRGPT